MCDESHPMRTESLYFYTDGFNLYDFGPEHPFSPLRQSVTHSLIEACGLLKDGLVTDIEPLCDDTLELIHTPEYIDVVKMAGQADGRFPPQAGIGLGDTPAFFSMHEAAALRVAATMQATEAVASGEALHAVNLGGGLHHAFADRAAGFCVYNDAAIAIEYLRRQYGWRVAYIDIDAHHGDGVQWCFYDKPDVLTISFHETGQSLFPGTGDIDEMGEGAGYGTSINVPLQPGTSDASWLDCFTMIVPELLQRFAPDLIISQHGVDAHHLDPLTNLQLSCNPLEKAAVMLHDLAHELCEGRWVALGGGGYDLWRVVPRAWTALWATASHQRLPDTTPAPWREKWQAYSRHPLPTSMRDQARSDEGPNVYKDNLATARYVLLRARSALRP